MATRSVNAPDARGNPAIEVWISPTIEREFKRREVFPHLRIENARCTVRGATGVYDISIEEAEAILEDAELQRDNRALRRGIPVAFSSLAKCLRPAIRHAKGLWDDPGAEEVISRIEQEFARFHAGDEVRYWSPLIDDPLDGEPLVITGGYELRGVFGKNGAFLTEDGKRFDYAWGYTARRPNGSQHFYPAYKLQRENYTVGHLRLVETRPTPHDTV